MYISFPDYIIHNLYEGSVQSRMGIIQSLRLKGLLFTEGVRFKIQTMNTEKYQPSFNLTECLETKILTFGLPR